MKDKGKLCFRVWGVKLRPPLAATSGVGVARSALAPGEPWEGTDVEDEG